MSTTKKHVFISYCHENREQVEQLCNDLKNAEENIWWDKFILGGENWKLEIKKAIKNCYAFILCLSKELENRDQSGVYPEIQYAIEEYRKCKPGKIFLIPVRLSECTIPELGINSTEMLEDLKCIDLFPSSQRDDGLKSICQSLKKASNSLPLTSSPNESTHDQEDKTALPPVQKLPQKYRMPYRPLKNDFIGRVKELWAIHDAFKEDQTAIIGGVGIVSGTGGLGKTQLAIEYVHRFANYYQGGIFWIDSEQGISALIEQLIDGAELEIDPRLNQDKQLENIWKIINGFQKDVLIVLDNFDEKEPLTRIFHESDSFFCKASAAQL